MAKKKPAKAKKTAAGRKAAAKSHKKASAVARRKPAPKPAANGGPSASALGRPKVTGDEPLYLLFREDYHARQIFEFLRVRTVRELEEFSAGEILRRLSNPIKATVERIRSSLAERNRCLAGDEEFAVEHKSRPDAK